jgi:hypothetical protein
METITRFVFVARVKPVKRMRNGESGVSRTAFSNNWNTEEKCPKKSFISLER